MGAGEVLLPQRGALRVPLEGAGGIWAWGRGSGMQPPSPLLPLLLLLCRPIVRTRGEARGWREASRPTFLRRRSGGSGTEGQGPRFEATLDGEDSCPQNGTVGRETQLCSCSYTDQGCGPRARGGDRRGMGERVPTPGENQVGPGTRGHHALAVTFRKKRGNRVTTC